METFNDFKKSFSYGDRNNNNFKFLANMSDDDAADFIEKLIHEAGAALDHGSVDNIVDLITSTGHSVQSDDPSPFNIPNMTQEEASNFQL